MAKKEKAPKADRLRMGEVRITRAAQLKRPKSMLLFGEPKRGKSTFAASICKVPGIDKVLMVDIDRGSSAIASDYPEIEVAELTRGDIAGFQKFWNNLVAEDGMDYDAIIVDTVSILQKWKVKSLPKADGFARWEAVGDWTEDLMWDLHNMSPIGISTFHTEMANVMRGAEDNSYVKLLPSIQGAAKRSIGAIPDLIGFCDVEEVDEDDKDYDENSPLLYTVRLKPSEETNTGNRFNKLPAVLGNPSMKRLFEIIEKGL